ncbi:hypothetical protein [Falsibacillus albus]|uniref:DUF5668 domain-containing protein n=1 Tax=Falsibacillus albus TaxID=2478915 RepID=A0A3L7JU11_9BACI|nr:hypothetical protein [Falsibacillus albus]RLQ93764.1 hypothetical protein D9X91_15935 [Falsibacillus albus]
MRTWRVGTITMGAALLFLGVFLLLIGVLDIDGTQVMMAWWPVLLIILGGEILVFLYLKKDEKASLKFDLLSIFFVGLIGTIGIGLSALTATGVLAKVTDTMNAEIRTEDLPAFNQTFDQGIKRVVIQAGEQPLTIEGSSGSALSIFGTYRADMMKGKSLISKSQDYVQSEKHGDTLYLTLKRPPAIIRPFDTSAELSATVVVPSKLMLEVEAGQQSISLKPRKMITNWTIHNGGDVSIQVSPKTDMTVYADHVESFGEAEGWVPAASKNTGDHSGSQSSAVLKIGKGTNSLSIDHSYSINIIHQN